MDDIEEDEDHSWFAFGDHLKTGLKSGKIKIDMHGHMKKPIGEVTYDKFGDTYDHYLDKLTMTIEILHISMYSRFKDIQDALKRGDTIPWTVISKADCLTVCGCCGEQIGLEYNGRVIRSQGADCAEPGGIKSYSVEIDCPSGVLLFADDLRHVITEDKDYSMGNAFGTKQLTEFYATQNMFHIYVGNSCPTVFQDAPDHLVIGNHGSYDDDPLTEEQIEISYIEGNAVTTVTTDLWWVCGIDEGIYDKLCKERNIVPDTYVDRVKVPSGRYKLTYYTSGIRDYTDDDHDPYIMATIEKVD